MRRAGVDMGWHRDLADDDVCIEQRRRRAESDPARAVGALDVAADDQLVRGEIEGDPAVVAKHRRADDAGAETAVAEIHHLRPDVVRGRAADIYALYADDIHFHRLAAGGTVHPRDADAFKRQFVGEAFHQEKTRRAGVEHERIRPLAVHRHHHHRPAAREIERRAQRRLRFRLA